LQRAATHKEYLSVRQEGNRQVKRPLDFYNLDAIISVGYISLERIIEDNKERYYEVLEQSSQRWHEGKHDPWPTLNFLLFILTQACKEFEQRVGQIKSPRGEKTALVEEAIARQTGLFSLSELQSACPGVSVDLIRSVLKRLKGVSIECLGRGHTAKWRKRAK
jgi:hypothetical protein